MNRIEKQALSNEPPASRPKSLVTGGAGFIGSHLVQALVARGERVLILDDLSTGRRENVAHLLNDSPTSAGAELVVNSVENRPLLSEMMAEVETVYHLAALTTTMESVENPEKSIKINDIAVYNLYEAASQNGIRRVVLASSSAVYGDRDVPHHEELSLRPNTPYAIHKLLGEHYGLFFTQYRNLPTTYLRFFNVYGPRQLPDSPYSGVISLFMEALANGRQVTIYDDGHQTRDFVYVDDVVQALIAAGTTATGAEGLALNVGSGKAVSILELYHRLAALIGQESCQPLFLPPRPGDVRHSSGPLDLAFQHLNWQAEVDLSEGLERTWQWFQTHSLRKR